jgi:hypothetical protein
MLRADRQRPELVKGEAPARQMRSHVLDPVQLGIPVRITGLLPGPGALEADAASVQDLPQPLPPHGDRPVGVAGYIRGQLAQAPARERQAQLLRPGGGRRDDQVNVLVTDPAGTASRPPRVQCSQPLGVEQMDHIADGVLIGGDQPGNRRHRGTRRRGHDDHRPPDPDRPVLAPPHDLLQPLPFLIGQPPRPDRFGHRALPPLGSTSQDRVWDQLSR